MRHLGSFSIALSAFLVALPALAQLTQPDGTEIPYIDSDNECGDHNIQQCLDDFEGDRTVDAMQDGNSVPETFDPSCNLQFDILARGAGYNNIFGWYNVIPDPDHPGRTLKPDVEDLHTFILGTEDPEFSRTLSLKGDPDYEGGDIGFFIATGSNPEAELGGPPEEGTYETIFYSEKAFNPDGDEDDPYIHLIIWQSVTYNDAFYFGWEDKLTDNDNDFDDIFTRVSGIQCSGGGEACPTGEEGVCAEGTMQCQQGHLTCVPNVEPSEEECDALDNDCDGEVDDGDLCPGDLVCDRGKCVPSCSSGEFPCPSGLVCSQKDTCVDPACEDVECDAGQICEGGTCVDACEGVTCPYGHVCRLGLCVDPCASIQCDDGYSCNLGVCVDCDCKGCDDGFTCSDNVCVEDACAAVTCDAGTHCAGGVCVDNCEGVVCPGGAACVAGACEAPGSGSGSGGEAGADATGSGGTLVIGTGGTSNGGSSAGTRGVGEGGESGEGEGCGCRTVGAPGLGSRAALLSILAALGFAWRRRRR